jgi:hypothetical protein
MYVAIARGHLLQTSIEELRLLFGKQHGSLSSLSSYYEKVTASVNRVRESNCWKVSKSIMNEGHS